MAGTTSLRVTGGLLAAVLLVMELLISSSSLSMIIAKALDGIGGAGQSDDSLRTIPLRDVDPRATLLADPLTDSLSSQ